MSFHSRVLSLFFILNAIGNIPLFVGLLGRYDLKKQRRIIARELTIALFILLMFNYFGDSILMVLGITRPIIGIAGGTLLFIIALGMIFPRPQQSLNMEREPIIVPFAMPIIAGPGSITAVMIFSEELHSPWLTTAIIVSAWIPTLIILLAASNIKYLLGERGLTACERLGGMLISLFAVQMFTYNALELIKQICLPDH